MKELKLNILNTQKESKLLNILLYAIIVILILLIILFNLVSLCTIKGNSMLNTLFNDQNILLLRTKNVSRGDIIVVQTDKPIIKRVIALQNDEIIFAQDSNKNVALYLNSNDDNIFTLLNEPYILESMQSSWFGSYECFYNGIYSLLKVESFNHTITIDDRANLINQGYIIKMEANEYFVLGDNRQISSDSRTIGEIKKENIFGKLLYVLEDNSFLERLFVFLYGAKQAQ